MHAAQLFHTFHSSLSRLNLKISKFVNDYILFIIYILNANIICLCFCLNAHFSPNVCVGGGGAVSKCQKSVDIKWAFSFLPLQQARASCLSIPTFRWEFRIRHLLEKNVFKVHSDDDSVDRGSVMGHLHPKAETDKCYIEWSFINILVKF